MNTHRGLSPRGYDFAEAERVKYDAYGKQAVLADNGIVAYKPSDYGQFVGFTGRYHDWETGLEYFRARYFDNLLGRFIGRDPLGYVDGSSLYNAYFVPNGVDPFGLYEYVWSGTWTADQKYELDKLLGQTVEQLFKLMNQIDIVTGNEWLGKCPKTHAKMIADLKRLRKMMDRIITGVRSHNEKLQLEWGNIEQIGLYKKYPWTNHIVVINADYVTQLGPKMTDDERIQWTQVLAHELSHKYGTDDDEANDPYNSGVEYGSLMAIDKITSWTPVAMYMRKIQIESKKGNCKCE